MTRRVLVARMDSMGDVLLAGPAVRAVAASGAEVVLLTGPHGAAAGRLLPGVATVRTIAVPWITATDRPVDDALVAEVRALVDDVQPDAVVVLTSFHQSPLPLALLLRLAGATRITGASVDAAGGLLDTRLLPGETLPEDLPEPERALAIADAAGFVLPADDDGRLAVRLPHAPPAAVAALPRPYLVVHPGAQAPSRTWPADSHAAAVERLTDAGRTVVVTGGPGERDLTASVAGTRAIDLGGALDLAGMAALLAGAGLLIAGNTGPAHLAAAVGTPVVSLFSPVVSAVRWAPYGVPTVLLGDRSAACAGTRATVCPVPGHPCLAGVGPDEVVDAAERLLTTAGVRG